MDLVARAWPAPGRMVWLTKCSGMCRAVVQAMSDTTGPERPNARGQAPATAASQFQLAQVASSVAGIGLPNR